MRIPSPGLRGLTVVAAVTIAVASTGVAFATPGGGITSTNISVGRFDDIRLKSRVRRSQGGDRHEGRLRPVRRVQRDRPGRPHRLAHAPGTEPHHRQDRDGHGLQGRDPPAPGTSTTTGEGFLDPGDGQVHILRNESGAPPRPSRSSCCPAGAVRRIDVENPGYCPF